MSTETLVLAACIAAVALAIVLSVAATHRHARKQAAIATLNRWSKGAGGMPAERKVQHLMPGERFSADAFAAEQAEHEGRINAVESYLRDELQPRDVLDVATPRHRPPSFADTEREAKRIARRRDVIGGYRQPDDPGAE